MLKRKTLGFWDQEVGVEEAGGAEGAPDEEDLGAQVALVCVDHVRGDDCDDLLQSIISACCLHRIVDCLGGLTYTIPQPIGGSRQSDTAGADRQREDLPHYDPSTRTPCGGEEEDVDANE